MNPQVSNENFKFTLTPELLEAKYNHMFSFWATHFDEIIKSRIQEKLDELYEDIKHGDEEHQKWLKDKIEEFKKSL